MRQNHLICSPKPIIAEQSPAAPNGGSARVLPLALGATFGPRLLPIAALMTRLGYPCSADDAAARLGYWPGDPMSGVLVAERDGAVIGCLSVHAVPYLERAGRWARIESLVIGESARGVGAAAALVRAAEQRARRWGCLVMEVASARTGHDARAFYQRMGFYRRLPPVRAIPQRARGRACIRR